MAGSDGGVGSGVPASIHAGIVRRRLMGVGRTLYACTVSSGGRHVDREDPEVTDQKSTPAASDDRPVVLVVDDEAPIRELFVATLARGGYVGIQAATGLEALRVLATHRVDVVLLDRSMPDMSGDALLRRLRSDPRTAPVSVVMVSGDGRLESKVDGLGAGANDYVVKPVAMRELLARVAAQVEERSRWHGHLEEKLTRRARLSAELAALPAGLTRPQLEAGLEQVLSEEFAFEGLELRPWVDAGDRLTHPRGPALVPEFAHGRERLRARIPLWGTDRVVATLEIVTGSAHDELMPTLLDLAPQIAALLGASWAHDASGGDARRWVQDVLAGGGLRGVFQPIVSLDDRSVVGVEGLTRFGDGTAPDVAFRSARRAGLGTRLESMAMQRLVSGATALPDGCWLSLNLSAATLLAADLEQVVAGADRPLVLEITEHEHVGDYTAVRARSAALDNVRFAVDDAGAGYASLRHIFELRPQLVKLDRSWVAGIDTDPVRQALIRGMVGFTEAIDALIVGEGVEREAEADALSSLGVQLGQGYLFGRPEAA